MDNSVTHQKKNRNWFFLPGIVLGGLLLASIPLLFLYFQKQPLSEQQIRENLIQQERCTSPLQIGSIEQQVNERNQNIWIVQCKYPDGTFFEIECDRWGQCENVLERALSRR